MTKNYDETCVHCGTVTSWQSGYLEPLLHFVLCRNCETQVPMKLIGTDEYGREEWISREPCECRTWWRLKTPMIEAHYAYAIPRETKPEKGVNDDQRTN